jgi:hypothetical protein
MSRLERGVVNPTVGVLEQIAGALGPQISEFFVEPVKGASALKPAGRWAAQTSVSHALMRSEPDPFSLCCSIREPIRAHCSEDRLIETVEPSATAVDTSTSPANVKSNDLDVVPCSARCPASAPMRQIC